MDLWTMNMTKKEQLYCFIRDREFVRTSEVIRWGTENFSNRADRDARLLGAEKKIRRLTPDEKIIRGYGKSKEDVWTLT